MYPPAATLCVALLAAPALAADPADAIYHGGDVVTIDDKNPTAEAVAVRGGRIVAVGKKADVLQLKGENTNLVDLKGKALLPGFLDGHSHFVNCLQVAQQANCFAPPAGPGGSIKDIVTALKQVQEKYQIKRGEFVVGYGYDGNELADGREMTAADLDAAFPDHPVFVQHVSLHGAVCNSAALRRFNISKDTPTPKGGVINRKPGTMEPEGLVMESAWIPAFLSLPKPTDEELLKRFKDGQMIYAAAGITTAQEGSTPAHDVALLRKAARQGLLDLDVVAYPFIVEAKAVLRDNPPETFGKYSGRFKLGGIKVTTDGSPQGRTAFFTTNYIGGGPGGEKDWRGEPLFPQAELDEFVKTIYDHNLQLLIHCNGDAAIDMFLSAHEKAAKDRTADLRTTVIHSQFVRKDQLEKYAAYKIVPSYYTAHCFYFGETHVKLRGREQAEFLSPLATSLKMGLRFSNHTDFNVAPIDQMFVVWSAVSRTTRRGEVLGRDERVTPLQALKAITLDAAYMYREEKTKGSLEVGKLADLVILDRNPLAVRPDAIKDIKVVETIKEGKTIYAAR